MSPPKCLIGLIAVVLMVGCGGNDSQTPVLPSDTQYATQESSNPSTQSSSHYLWGYWLLSVNPENDEIEILPAREIAGHWNVLKWLEQGPCADCLNIVEIIPNPSGTKCIYVKIIHPFASPNLTGFDVRGIAMFNGSHTFPVSGLTTPDYKAGDGELVNADGYTTLYNSTTAGSGPGGLQGYLKGKFATVTAPSALLNAYKRYRTNDPANTRNAFYAGYELTVMYEIMMPTSALVFGYAVDASWVKATTIPVTDPMADFPPSANCPEPWCIVTDTTPVGIGLNTQGGEAKLTLDVYDYQGKNSHYPPIVECPELFSGTKSATWVSNGPGFSTWEVTVGNENLADIGDYECLVKVVDHENAGSPWYLDLTAYQIMELSVSPWINVPPVAIAKCNPMAVIPGQEVSFEDNGSHDPDGGSITKYEWDWENDGVFDEEGPYTTHTWDSPGTYYVQFRVTDDENETDILDIPLNVVVMPEGCTGNLVWAKAAAGEGLDFSGGIDTLSDNSIVFTGSFNSAITLALGEPNETTLPCSGSLDILIARYNSDGSLAWAKKAGGSYMDGGQAVACLSDDSISVTGGFGNSATFGEGEPNETTLEATSDSHIDEFIAKYNPDGTLAWVKRSSSPIAEIVALPDDSIVTTGYFEDCATFGEGEPNETTLCTSYYDPYQDLFVAKYNPDGTLAWAKRAGGDRYDYSFGIAALSDDSTVITGEFLHYAVFGEGEPNEVTLAVPANDFALFVARYNPNGTLAWAVQSSGDEDAGGQAITSLSDDSTVVIGSFIGPITLGPGEPNEVTLPIWGIFIAWYNPDGTLASAKSVNAYLGGYGITSLSDDSVVITGSFAGSATFGQGEPNEVTLVSSGDDDIFVARYMPDGSLCWAKAAGSPESFPDHSYSITSLSDDSTVAVGYFWGPAMFGAGEPNEVTLPWVAEDDIFIARFMP